MSHLSSNNLFSSSFFSPESPEPSTEEPNSSRPSTPPPLCSPDQVPPTEPRKEYGFFARSMGVPEIEQMLRDAVNDLRTLLLNPTIHIDADAAIEKFKESVDEIITKVTPSWCQDANDDTGVFKTAMTITDLFLSVESVGYLISSEIPAVNKANLLYHMICDHIPEAFRMRVKDFLPNLFTNLYDSVNTPLDNYVNQSSSPSSSSTFRMLVDFISSLVGIPIASNSDVVSACKQLGPVVNLFNGTANASMKIINWFYNALKIIYDWVTGETAAIHNHAALAETWCSLSLSFCNDSIIRDRFARDISYARIFVQHVYNGNFLITYFTGKDKYRSLLGTLNSCMKKLDACRSSVDAIINNAIPRPSPLFINIKGGTSLGKTTYVIPGLIERLKYHVHKESSGPQDNYRDPNGEYDDGYNGQFAWTFDDIFQINDAKRSACALNKMFQFSGDEACMLNHSDVARKATHRFESHLVINVSNSGFNPAIMNQVDCKQAFMRRWHYDVEVRVKQEYLNPQGHVDVSNPKVATDGYDIYEFKQVNTSNWVSFEHLSSMMCNTYDRLQASNVIKQRTLEGLLTTLHIEKPTTVKTVKQFQSPPKSSKLVVESVEFSNYAKMMQVGDIIQLSRDEDVNACIVIPGFSEHTVLQVKGKLRGTCECAIRPVKELNLPDSGNVLRNRGAFTFERIQNLLDHYHSFSNIQDVATFLWTNFIVAEKKSLIPIPIEIFYASVCGWSKEQTEVWCNWFRSFDIPNKVSLPGSVSDLHAIATKFVQDSGIKLYQIAMPAWIVAYIYLNQHKRQIAYGMTGLGAAFAMYKYFTHQPKKITVRSGQFPPDYEPEMDFSGDPRTGFRVDKRKLPSTYQRQLDYSADPTTAFRVDKRKLPSTYARQATNLYIDKRGQPTSPNSHGIWTAEINIHPDDDELSVNQSAIEDKMSVAIANSIMKGSMVTVRIGNGVASGFGLFDKFILIQKHMCATANEDGTDDFNYGVLSKGLTITRERLYDKHMVRAYHIDISSVVDKDDVSILYCPELDWSFPDIRKHFVRECDLDKINWGGATSWIVSSYSPFGPTIQSATHVSFLPHKMSTSSTNRPSFANRSVHGHCVNFAGMCGSPWIVADPRIQFKILGQHFSGVVHRSEGSAVLVTREDIEKISKLVLDVVESRTQVSYDMRGSDWFTKITLPYIDNHVGFEMPLLKPATIQNSPMDGLDGFQIVGSTDMSPRQPSTTQIKQSPLYNEDESTTHPAFLRVRRNEFGVTFPQTPSVLKQLVPISETGEQLVPFWYVDSIPPVINKLAMFYIRQRSEVWEELYRPLTDHENVRGFSTGVTGLVSSTSPGLPWNSIPEIWGDKKLVGKRNFLVTDGVEYTGTTGYFQCLIMNIEKKCVDTVPAIIATVFCKDERRKDEKIMCPRTISTIPVEYVYLIRKYFGGFIGLVSSCHNEGSIKIGINSRSQEWKILHDRMLSKGKNWFGFDYSSYDKRLPRQLMHAALDVVLRWYHSAHHNARQRAVGRGFPVSSPEEFKQEQRIRANLWKAITECYYQNGDVVYRMNYGNPSGNPLTTQINSLVNEIICRLAFHELFPEHDFSEHVELAVYGDDVIVSVSDECKEFDFFFMEFYLGRHNMKITWPSKKEGEERAFYENYLDTSFLKRTFKHINHKGKSYVVGPLDPEVINETPMWIREGIPEEEATKANLAVSLEEASLHGPVFYIMFASKMKQRCEENRLDYDFEGWVTVFERVVSKYYD